MKSILTIITICSDTIYYISIFQFLNPRGNNLGRIIMNRIICIFNIFWIHLLFQLTQSSSTISSFDGSSSCRGASSGTAVHGQGGGGRRRCVYIVDILVVDI